MRKHCLSVLKIFGTVRFILQSLELQLTCGTWYKCFCLFVRSWTVTWVDCWIQSGSTPSSTYLKLISAKPWWDLWHHKSVTGVCEIHIATFSICLFWMIWTFFQRPDLREVRGIYLKILQRICAHKFFTYFGCVIALINVVIISVRPRTKEQQLDTKSRTKDHVFFHKFATKWKGALNWFSLADRAGNGVWSSDAVNAHCARNLQHDFHRVLSHWTGSCFCWTVSLLHSQHRIVMGCPLCLKIQRNSSGF